MDEERIKQIVLSAIDRAVDARVLAEAVEALASERPSPPLTRENGRAPPPSGAHGSPATQKLLTRIVLGDILDDSILGARPQDRTFPLRLLFSELSSLLVQDGTPDRPDNEAETRAADRAFTLASGLNFFFRAAMDDEAKMRVGLEVSRQLYHLADEAKIDIEIVSKAAPLLATIMSSELERIRFESVDHAKVFDSQTHERTLTSDAAGSRIIRPASFLCRVQANNAVKAKAQVVT